MVEMAQAKMKLASILTALLLLSTPARAIPCALVKAGYAPFAKQGLKAAENWMREHGYSEKVIKEALACLAGR